MVTIVRQVLDEIDVGDNTVYYSRHKIDTIPVSELVSGRVIRYKIVSDTITTSDSIIRRLRLKRLVQDTTTLSESIRLGGENLITVFLSDIIELIEHTYSTKEKAHARIEIHPEQPFYPRRRRSRFQKRFEYMTL